MSRILIVECMQEISSFNPMPSGYENFAVQRGMEMLRQAGLNTAVGGALAVFGDNADVEVVPTYSARAGSAGLLSAAGWARLSGECIAAVASGLTDIDGIYVSMHGAMGADGELDPEGFLLSEIRKLAGPRHPHRGLARSARHPHRPNAASDRRTCDLSHLSACRFRRHRRASRSFAAAADTHADPNLDRAGGHSRPGTRRRADHQKRLLRRHDRRMQAAGGRWPGAGGWHHDRQSLHRRAGAVQPGDRGD